MATREGSRLALSLTALISGLMGFIESIVAAPAQSTAMAAAALGFLLISSVAWLELWTGVGAFRHPSIIMRAIGFVLMMLGAGVLLVAAARLSHGSHPEPRVMAMFAGIGFAANLSNAVFELKARGRVLRLAALWGAARNHAAVNGALLAAAGATLLTGSNMADIALGGALAALGLVTGARILARGAAP